MSEEQKPKKIINLDDKDLVIIGLVFIAFCLNATIVIALFKLSAADVLIKVVTLVAAAMGQIITGLFGVGVGKRMTS